MGFPLPQGEFSFPCIVFWAIVSHDARRHRPLAREVTMDASTAKTLVNDKSQVQVIARAATILRALEDENSGLSLGQIAQRVKLARSTVQRIVSALETEKLVIAATPNGRVRLGPAILRLGGSRATRLLSSARPF